MADQNDQGKLVTDSSAGDKPTSSEPPIRWSLVVAIVAAFALVVGFGIGRIAPIDPLIVPKVANETPDGKPDAAEEERTPAPELPDPDRPLPATRDELNKEVEAVLVQMTETYPNNPDVFEMKARVELWQGNTEGAEENWQQCLKIDPQYAHAYVGMANVAADKGEHDRAVELADKAVRVNPASFQARTIKAESLIELGKPEEAIKALEDYLKRDPRSQGFYLVAQAYVQEKNYEKARDNYLAAIAIYPEYCQAYHGLSEAYSRLEDKAAAKKALDKANELESLQESKEKVGKDDSPDMSMRCRNAATLYSDVGRVCLVTGNVVPAENYWLRAAALDAENVSCRQSLAFLYVGADRVGETIGWLKELADIEPRNHSYWIEIGRLYDQLASYEAAERALQKAYEIAPNSVDCVSALADFYLRYEKKVPEAVKLARAALKLSPTPAHHAMLGAALRLQGDFDGALAEINEAIKIAPNVPSYLAVRDSLKEEIAKQKKE